MAIPLRKLTGIVFLLFFCPPLSHGLMSNRCPSHESQALLLFKAALNDSNGYLSSWVNGTDCCTSWYGISCDDNTNHVISVEALSFHGVISESICQLRFLTSLTISGVYQGTTTIPPCLGNLSYIELLDLFSNSFSGMIPPLVCLLTRLKVLDLSSNNLNGSIPSCLGNLASLTYLKLSYNQLSGRIPASLGSLSLLRNLYLDNNQLSGIVPDSLGNLSLLERLDISNNQLSGTIPPSFAHLSSLTALYAAGNRFNETVFSLSLPPSLHTLYLSLHHYQSISETSFHNLTRLSDLYLCDCVLNISTTWIPPFDLSYLHLVSCMIDGEFPPWISTQISLEWLVITNASLVGVFPSWLWETSPQLTYLNLSGNHLEGSLFSNTSSWMKLGQLDLARNKLSGCIPSTWPSYMSILLLNDNLFSGNIHPNLGKLSNLNMLNLANNKITGVIPVSLSNCSLLIVLNLGNNSLEGSLPHEFSNLRLLSLVLRNNNLHGPFPPIANSSMLQVLDIGNNLFEGQIPTLIGNISELKVLIMKENKFTGSIPLEIGQLKHLQILLLSSNHISGSIPHTIVFLQAMANESQNGFVLTTYTKGPLYQDGLDMTLKGTDQHYQYILSTLTSIDLSSNELEGKVPSNFGDLKGLRLLNLSMNNLNGTIPKSFGEMHQLDSLDLSRNHFSGQIPTELESLSFLGSLDLSNNNLSGSIPQGIHMIGFGESSYSGNPNLWGCPLPRNCSWPQFVPSPPPIYINKIKKSTKYPWYAISLGLSFGMAFGGIISLIVIKISWRNEYFNKVDAILKFLFPWMKNLTL
ncbi:receptor-like protein EIX2 [Cryptomeria japonica]|uniref:receptor-like protein EIX2 n=1 Tax=Cryptomeria japonica TaxID=3369 RepID=UPI0027DA8C96|nr:receptor-like protein EIX2 [Cryptomeria japonica]